MFNKLILLIVCFISNLLGQSIFSGQEFQVNNPVYNNSCYNPEIATLSDGSVAICYSLFLSNECQVACQLYDKYGAKLENVLLIDTPYSTQMVQPQIASLPNNNFIIYWSTFNFNWGGEPRAIWFQIFTFTGTKIKTVVDRQLVSTDYGSLAIASSPNGNFITCWRATRGILCKTYDQNGESITQNEIKLSNYYNSYVYDPSAIAIDENKFFVCWTDEDSSAKGAGGQFIDVAGNKIGGNVRINTYQLHEQGNPSATVLSNGNIVVCYMGWDGAGSGGTEWSPDYDIFAQVFNSIGDKLGGELRVNMNSAYNQKSCRIASGENNFVIVWHDMTFNPYMNNIKAQFFTLKGNPIGDELQISPPNSDSEHDEYPSIASIGEDNYLVTWMDCPPGPPSGNIQVKKISLGDATTIVQRGKSQMSDYLIHQNYPNPFNPTTTIKYELPTPGHVTIKIFDLTGRLVKILADNEQNAGAFSVQWDGTNLIGNTVAAGIYIYRVEFVNSAGEKFIQSRKMSLVK